MMKLFGGGPTKKAAPNATTSINNLRETLQMLEKREDHLEGRIQGELKEARKNAAINKRAAIMNLKRKKAYEDQIKQLGGARMTLETQILAIEASSTHFAALSAMQEGARTMKSLNRNMDVDDVEDVMEDIREQIEVSREVGDAISTPLGLDDVSESEYEEELEALMNADLQEQFQDVALPSVPANAPVAAPAAAPQTEDDEFAALGMEMGF
eukprot:TRINITY_DN10625_c0_g1_i2.p1 TRINITY_DN10625_c0_g1~~TRINITY_DN10625_c0_g1_i2.p1  ORF type:complete len:228 (+),score=84.29 TRINITY_DN10625_c0_g1_i2:50-685(+)